MKDPHHLLFLKEYYNLYNYLNIIYIMFNPTINLIKIKINKIPYQKTLYSFQNLWINLYFYLKYLIININYLNNFFNSLKSKYINYMPLMNF